MIKNDYGDGDVDALNFVYCYIFIADPCALATEARVRALARQTDICVFVHVSLTSFVPSKCNN